ncbi:ribosome-associated protein [Acinetobacter sp. DSM 11652]|nr:ribosome-associated protein [Acinetobacter sp. DSM 11652]
MSYSQENTLLMNLEPSPGASNSHELSLNSPKQDVQACLKVVQEALLDVKAKEITTIDVSEVSNVADAIVIASGTSTRHVKALANNVADEARKAGFRPIGIEGESDAEWILVDLGTVVVHLMLPTARKFYDLENLWRNASTTDSVA